MFYSTNWSLRWFIGYSNGLLDIGLLDSLLCELRVPGENIENVYVRYSNVSLHKEAPISGPPESSQ